MNTIMASAAAVTGARHLRMARNGQDAAAAWTGARGAVAVVCDGCGSGASSEVGARLGARLLIAALARRLVRGEPVTCEATWSAVRAEVGAALAAVLDHLGDDREAALREQLLFTIVAAALGEDGAAVWALGDGAYAIDGETRVLGPFADNQPPYLGYDLLGEPRDARFEAVRDASSLVVASDGVLDLGGELAPFTARRYAEHPDALRRELVTRARGNERIDWDERRVVRVPAALQDDGAIGVVLR